MSFRAATAAALLAALVPGGCGKQAAAPKADAAKEQAQALERSKQGAFGTQVQALDAAKGMGADLNQKALDAVDKAEKDAK